MKGFAAVLLLALAAFAARAQVAAPDDWRKETFTFPLIFAPTIPYEGAEYVRFAPYWAENNAERGFTYVILWDLKRREFEPAELERGLNVYFDGLMEQVTRARKIEDTGVVTSVTLHPLTAPEGWQQALGGRVHTWNAFVKGEPLLLHLEIATRACGADRSQVFFAFSRAERAQALWNDLRAIRSATTCSTVTSG